MPQLPGCTQDHHVEWKDPGTAEEKAEDDASQTGKGVEAIVSMEGDTLHMVSGREKVNNPSSLSKVPLATEQAFIPIN